MLTFGGILLAMFLGSPDQAIVSTALPRIVADLHGLDRFTWVATAYLVASTALVPIYGKLADMYSRRTIEVVAVSVFLVGSGLCGLAGEFGPLPLLGDGMGQLVVSRAVQGLGGAGLFAMAFIIIADGLAAQQGPVRLDGPAHAGLARRGRGGAGVLVVGGLAITLFIPELPLRKTNAGPPAAGD